MSYEIVTFENLLPMFVLNDVMVVDCAHLHSVETLFGHILNNEAPKIFSKIIPTSIVDGEPTINNCLVAYNNGVDEAIACIQSEITPKELSKLHKVIDCVFTSTNHENLSKEDKYLAFLFADDALTSDDNNNEILSYKVSISNVPNATFDDYIRSRSYFDEIDSIVQTQETFSDRYEKLCEFISRNPNQLRGITGYSFETFLDYFHFLVCNMIKKDVDLKRCKNCNRYFVPTTRSDTIYCSNSAPQDEAKTCGEYMKYKNYLEKTRNDEATKLYKQLYNSKRNRTMNCSDIKYKSELEQFIATAKQWKADIKTGIKSEQDYILWLKSVKEKKV